MSRAHDWSSAAGASVPSVPARDAGTQQSFLLNDSDIIDNIQYVLYNNVAALVPGSWCCSGLAGRLCSLLWWMSSRQYLSAAKGSRAVSRVS